MIFITILYLGSVPAKMATARMSINVIAMAETDDDDDDCVRVP